jgi:hypothetical protein
MAADGAVVDLDVGDRRVWEDKGELRSSECLS